MHVLLSLLLAFQQQTSQPASPIAKVVVTPTARSVVVGDTLRLRAQAVDAQGNPVSGAIIRFYPAGPSFEGRVDTAGLVLAGAAGSYPVAAVATVPGARPTVERLTLSFVPGPAARVEVTPAPRRMLAGQRLRLGSRVLSAAGDVRDDRVAWRSSAPAVVRVGDGVLTAV